MHGNKGKAFDKLEGTKNDTNHFRQLGKYMK